MTSNVGCANIRRQDGTHSSCVSPSGLVNEVTELDSTSNRSGEKNSSKKFWKPDDLCLRMCNREHRRLFCDQNMIMHAHSNLLHVLCNTVLTANI